MREREKMHKDEKSKGIRRRPKKRTPMTGRREEEENEEVAVKVVHEASKKELRKQLVGGARWSVRSMSAR